MWRYAQGCPFNIVSGGGSQIPLLNQIFYRRSGDDLEGCLAQAAYCAFVLPKKTRDCYIHTKRISDIFTAKFGRDQTARGRSIWNSLYFLSSFVTGTGNQVPLKDYCGFTLTVFSTPARYLSCSRSQRLCPAWHSPGARCSRRPGWVRGPGG